MNRPTVISAFAGCGGSSLGYKMAGFKELLAIEWEENAVETFKANFPEVPIWKSDICQVKANEVMDFCNIKKGELDILDGSPPCQGFSTAGRRKVNDVRNDLFKPFLNMINEIQPKVFIMENVSGQVKGKMKGKFIEIIQSLKFINYRVKSKLMNSVNYNVPQSRQRMIYIGVRNDLDLEPIFPEKNNKKVSFKESMVGINNSGEEIVFPDPKQIVFKKYKLAEIIKMIAPGRTATDILGYGKGFGLRRINPNRPSHAIIKFFSRRMTAGTLHPYEDRFLTIMELKRIFSFPDNFIFIGSFEERWARLGNCVPPLFIKAIAETIKDKILSSIPDEILN